MTMHEPQADRREAMLVLLLAAQAERVRTRRRRRRIGAVAAVAGAVVLLVAVVGPWPGKGTPAGAIAQDGGARSGERSIAPDAPERAIEVEPAAPIASPSRVAIHRADDAAAPLVVRVGADPTVLDRLRRAGSGRVRLLDDGDLLRTLAEAGRPTGLISVGGTKRLTTPVVEDDLGSDDDGARRTRPERRTWWSSVLAL